MRYYTTPRVLKKYSCDRSDISITPRAVCYPRDEREVQEAIAYAKRKGWTVIARGGGTGLSGAAVGDGLILDLSKHLRKTKTGRITFAQAGALIKDLRPKVEKTGYMLPSSPLYEECAIGGNVNTRSVGPRTVKYGSYEKQLVSCTVVLADGRIIDTARTLPKDITDKLTTLKKSWRMIKHLAQKRPPQAGGYNLLAFACKDPRKILTQLLVGSTGTLGIITDMQLRLPCHKPLYAQLRYYANFDALQKDLNKLCDEAAFIEFIDMTALKLLPKKYNRTCAGALLLGFEKKRHDASALHLTERERRAVWDLRAKTLDMINRKAKHLGYTAPSILDDVTIHPSDFSKAMQAVDRYFKTQKITYYAYGHAGVGSLHIRPLLRNKRQQDKIIKDTFAIMQQYNGTLVGEHNAGRERQAHIKAESKRIYTFMAQIKQAFDPNYVFNRVLYNTKYINASSKK